MSERHGHRYDKVQGVNMWQRGGYGGIAVQFVEDVTSHCYPYTYRPSDASINRLLRAVRGWYMRYAEGVFYFTKPELDKLDKAREQITEVRDLLRTGLPPEGTYISRPGSWEEHKCNRAAGELTRLLEELDATPRWKPQLNRHATSAPSRSN